MPVFDEFLAKQDAIITEYGHSCVMVFGEDATSGFTYTVGLTEGGWPEIICMTLRETGQIILNQVVAKLRSEDRRPAYGMVVTEALNVPIHLIEIPKDIADEHLNVARVRALKVGIPKDTVTGLQAVWPDTEGKYPWDADYDHKNCPQPLLGKPAI